VFYQALLGGSARYVVCFSSVSVQMLSWPHFAASELVCRHCQTHRMQDEFMQRLEGLRAAFARPLVPSSAYRCGVYNARVSTTGLHGPHTTGRAVDIQISGPAAYELLDLALTHGFTGIGVQQKGPHGGRFVHLDDLPRSGDAPRPALWSY
jgi:zinc D-Ala-D-Ala carboxypeptidase